MKQIYRELMEQHGGSIPFHILGGVQAELRKRKKTVRRVTRAQRRKEKTKRRTRHRLNPAKYSVGTIIRQGKGLVRLNKSKQWLPV